MVFEWDERKSELNYQKHAIRFREAQSIFSDSHAIDFFDILHIVGEDRFIRVGISDAARLLVVVYCERELKLIRIISARRATTKEAVIYEERV